MSRFKPAFVVAAVAVVASCDQCDQAVLTRGNLDRVADVVVVNTVDGVSIAIAANPELQVLRVVDLTVGNFLGGPNRFSPLSIPTGLDTRQLALAVDVATSAADPTRLYALDGSDDVVQVIQLPNSDGGAPFVQIGKLVPVAPLPVDLAAIKVDDKVFVAVAHVDHVDIYDIDAATVVGSVDFADVDGVAAHASAIVADPQGHAFVVADAALPFVHVVDIVDGASAPVVKDLDVGGPTSALAAGVVDSGGGVGPVVVALRSDTPAIMVVRLLRPGFVEDRYAVLGGAALPSLGIEAYVPDARPVADEAPPTVCCRGLSNDAIAAGEATDAFATVWMANGDMLHVAIAATRLDGVDLPVGRTLVRLIDDDLAGPSAPSSVDLNSDETLWVPAEGGAAFRPTVQLTSIDNFGAPPFVPLIRGGTSLLLTWEGDLPRLKNLTGAWKVGDNTFIANRDVAARGARVGDVARFTTLNPSQTCPADTELRLPITAVVAQKLTLDVAAADDATADDCFGENPDDVRVTIEATDAFVVEDAGVLVARLAPSADGGAEASVALSGLTLSFTPSSAGLPLRGSKLAVPLDAHVLPMGMNLSEAVSSAGDGGLGVAAFIPTAMTGGTLVIPDAASDVDGATTPARRMVFSSGSVDGATGLPLLFTADEAETVPGRVESFR